MWDWDTFQDVSEDMLRFGRLCDVISGTILFAAGEAKPRSKPEKKKTITPCWRQEGKR